MANTNSPSDTIQGLVLLEVIEGKDFPKMDFGVFFSCDPYTTITFGHQKFKSKVVKKDLNPKWNETFRLLVRKSEINYPIVIEAWDYDFHTKNDYIGQVEVKVNQLFQQGPIDTWFDIKDAKNPSNTKHLGKIHIKLSLKTAKEVEREFWLSFASQFDVDKTGTISYPEMFAMVEQLSSRPSELEVQQLFARGDKNNDGQISFDEFVDLMSHDTVDPEHNPILRKVLPDGSLDFIFHVSQKLGNDTNVAELLMERGLFRQIEGSRVEDKLQVHDRATGTLVDEKIPDYIRVSMRLMYSTGTGRFTVDKLQAKKILSAMTRQQGAKYDNPQSKREIPTFIAYHQLNTDEILDPLDSFQNFNEFFYRKLKPNARAIASSAAVCPADCRMHVFPTIQEATELWVKGQKFSLSTLLQDPALESKFDGGSLVICRLAPQDYHRFHTPVDATVGSFKPFETNTYYTVNPIAIRQNVDVYTENKRTTLLLTNTPFGDMLYVAVGATMVGSIQWTVKEGQAVKKGDELGYFAFGGSTLLVFFQKNRAVFDEDLLINSQKPIETLVKLGMSLANLAPANKS